MPLIDVEVETQVSNSVRARQLSSMFDVPAQDRQKLSWKINAPWEEKPWSVGLIVGPSGAGKSTIMRHMFGSESKVEWGNVSVIDDFAADHNVNDIAEACSAVGFNTIPAWLRPFHVLSNGEQFRVTLARLMLDTPKDQPIVVDEFTSVVDRQVAKIGANAVQKFVRRNKRQFVAVTCHYDVEDWLQPDWVVDVAQGTFTWRSVQPRPRVEVSIHAVPYSTWALFAPYHYLDAHMHRGARCFAAFVDEQPAAFAGIMRRPHPKAKNIMGFTRDVTLPDWQGLGIMMTLLETVGAAYKVAGQRVRNYPAHPAFMRSHDRSKNWKLTQKPGYGTGNAKGVVHGPNAQLTQWRHGSRPCAVFEYVGPAWADEQAALDLLSEAHGRRIMPGFIDL